MAIDMAGRVSSTLSDQTALQEAAAAGLKSMENLVNLASQSKQSQPQIHPKQLMNLIAPLKRAIASGSTRTGHALFRRAPVQPPRIPIPPVQPSTNPILPVQPPTNPIPPVQPPRIPIPPLSSKALTLDFKKVDQVGPSKMKLCNAVVRSSSFLSSITGGDATVTNAALTTKAALTNNVVLTVSAKKPEGSAGKPPLPPLPVKRSREHDNADCHCMKRQNKVVKRTIRVPVASDKIADIPADNYSWRKYGQKPIKGSQFPRGYYRCSSVKGCPARKHVEKATDESMILIVTYKNEHNHNEKAKQETVAPVANGTVMVVESPSLENKI